MQTVYIGIKKKEKMPALAVLSLPADIVHHVRPVIYSDSAGQNCYYHQKEREDLFGLVVEVRTVGKENYKSPAWHSVAAAAIEGRKYKKKGTRGENNR